MNLICSIIQCATDAVTLVNVTKQLDSQHVHLHTKNAYFIYKLCYDFTLQSTHPHSKHSIVELLHTSSMMNKSNHIMLHLLQLNVALLEIK